MPNRSNRTSAGSWRPLLLGGSLIVLIIGVVVGLTLISGDDDTTPPTAAPVAAASAPPQFGAPVSKELLIRPDSHRVSPAAGDRVTFVEFLDFECEGCRAAYPAVEQLRADYAGRVDFVVRYFPLPSHRNAAAAAAAVEAASQQGRFEAMYQRMYETQATWGDQDVSHVETFRGFARDLGLDVARFDADTASAATAARVERDRQDGLAAGVGGTPTFFVNGRPLENVRGAATLKAALDQALAQAPSP